MNQIRAERLRKNMRVALLGSGNSLGAYIPAKTIQSRLRNKFLPAHFYVLESYYKDDLSEKIPHYRLQFHRNFSVAQMGYKLARGIDHCLDSEKIDRLFEEWSSTRIDKFVLFTGFWIPIIQRYIQQNGLTSSHVDIVRIDASDTPSFALYKEDCLRFRNIWLYDRALRSINLSYSIGEEAPIDYRDRPVSFVVHGGGWGIGDYRDIISELSALPSKLHVLAYEPDDIQSDADEESITYYMIRPDWNPWNRDANGQHVFPPFIRKGRSEVFEYPIDTDYPRIYDLIRVSSAIVSKPGGATLLDSLASASPLVVLKPFGTHEKHNAELWVGLGFGIYYQEWKERHFSLDVLHQLHLNLLRATTGLTPLENQIVSANEIIMGGGIER